MSAMNNFTRAKAISICSSMEELNSGLLSLDHYLKSQSHARAFFCCDDDSMIQQGIEADDLLVFETELKPFHRCLVIAKIGDELACRIFDETNRQLIAANPAYRTIAYDRSDVEIKGVVRNQIRTFSDAQVHSA